jgi:hypothetical protein
VLHDALHMQTLQAASRATSWEEKAVIRTVTLEMGIPPSDVKAAAGAVTKVCPAYLHSLASRLPCSDCFLSCHP